MNALHRASTVVALLAAAVWLGGILALGAIAAPVVFTVVPLPASADAMTLVFRRFDLVTMACAVLVLASESVRAMGRVGFAATDWGRLAVSVLASLCAVYEGELVSPKIAALHASGAIRGVGDGGSELSHLHDLAEMLGKVQVFLLVSLVVFHVFTLVPLRAASSESRQSVALEAIG